MELFVILAVAAVAIFIVRADAAEPVRDWLLSLANRKNTPPIEAPVVKEEVEPDPEPEKPRQGNVLINPEDTKIKPDLKKRYEFPASSPPVTRFEDLNRRLFVFDPQGTTSLDEIPQRAPSDFPLKLTGRPKSLRSLIDISIRPFYPVIIDRHGLFYRFSYHLERNPYLTDPLLDAYLSIPLAERPVIFSYSRQEPKKDNEKQQKERDLDLLRYGFEDFTFSFEFAKDHPADSFEYLFRCFRGEIRGWLWFSCARLRQHVFELNRPKIEAMQAAEKARQDEMDRVKALLDPRNKFEALWGHRSDRTQTPDPEPEEETAP